ncbi:hypothetical protein [Pseudomonas sp. PB3P13]
MKTVFAVTACLLSLAGCQDSEEQRLLTVANAAKKSIAARYKDPDAVQFKDLTLDWQQQHMCGMLNAKNGFGAYTGYERFRADLKGDGAGTVVTNVWTQTEMVNRFEADGAAGRLIASEAKTAYKIAFELMCDDVERLKVKGPAKTPISIPAPS